MSMRITPKSHVSHGPQVPNPIDHRQASSAVKKALTSKFESSGVVKLIGKPQVGFTSKAGVFSVSGKVDVNALWGGDNKYTFNATVNLNTGKTVSLKTKIFQST